MEKYAAHLRYDGAWISTARVTQLNYNCLINFRYHYFDVRALRDTGFHAATFCPPHKAASQDKASERGELPLIRNIIICNGGAHWERRGQCSHDRRSERLCRNMPSKAINYTTIPVAVKGRNRIYIRTNAAITEWHWQGSLCSAAAVSAAAKGCNGLRARTSFCRSHGSRWQTISFSKTLCCFQWSVINMWILLIKHFVPWQLQISSHRSLIHLKTYACHR